MKKIQFCCFLALLMTILPSAAFADQIDLAPLTTSQYWATGAGTGTSRGIIFNVTDDFSLDSIGIELNLTGAQTLTASLYAITGTATVGALLASASSQFADTGRSWFDIPISYSFEETGNRYLLEISFGGVAPQEAAFYNFQGYPSVANPNPPFTAGPISVYDGTLSQNPRNTALAHFRIGINAPSTFTMSTFEIEIPQTPSSVPEPSSIILLCSGMVGLVGFGRKLLK